MEHWFHTEAERFMLRHQGLGLLLIFMGVPLAALILVALGAGALALQAAWLSGGL